MHDQSGESEGWYHMLPIQRIARLILPVSMCLGLAACAGPEKTPAGLWDATITTLGGVEVPFRFEISGAPPTFSGSFFDGELRRTSGPGSFTNGQLVLPFDEYGAKVDVAYQDDRLEGKYDRGTRGRPYPFKAVRAVAPPAPAGAVPSIEGEWRIPLDKLSSKGESAWRMVVRQTGAEASAAIMRVDGDTGTLTGFFRDGTFTLSHFSGARPSVLQVTPVGDGSLQLVEDRKTARVAYRETDDRAKAAPLPTDPTHHIGVVDPSAKFTFSFPDLDGKIVSDADPRFAGKVVIVSLTGTWCPNCHDEAPFLAQLYKDYRRKGLEIVALAFEEPAQLKDLSRVRAFIKQYSITYPFLIAGDSDHEAEALPQAVNLNTFPAMFVLGKDGRVRATHAGYASKATGQYYMQEQKEFLAEIDRLLAES
jgi:thiol-disulfide isomerase/thioredoxin